MSYFNQKLEEFNNYLKNKKVAIIGIGVSNIPLIEYFHDLKSKVTVFDNKEIDEIDKDVMKKIVDYGMEFSFGKDYLNKLNGFDIIFRSPSCLPNKPELVREQERGAIVTTEVEMVLELTPCKTIGVTGSDGKTTTTTLISEILKNGGYKVWLGGNIGIPLFTEIKNMEPEDIVVLELSSFQLMEMKVSPNVAVITNITPNHLDKHTDMEEYINSKKNIFRYQNEDDVLVLNYDNDITRKCKDEAKSRVVFFSSKTRIQNGYIVDEGKIKVCKDGLRYHVYDTKNMILRGVHNFENACSAIIATNEFVDTDKQIEVFNTFKGVEHRLELVKETKEKVKWYNDSVSSSPTRTIAGLNAFPIRNIVLIAGGYDKNLDYTPIAKSIVENCKALVLLGQTADKIEIAVNNELKNSNRKIEIVKCSSLEETIRSANKLSEKGDIVLFSPASASFDMFKNFAQRGEMFKELVNKLIR